MWKAEEFWQFSCEHYQSRKAGYLQVQDEYGLNVNLLLLAAYLDIQGVELSAENWRKLISTTLLSDKALKDLRHQRRLAVKGSDSYRQTLSQELELEKQQQNQCINTLNQLGDTLSTEANNLPVYIAQQLQQQAIPYIVTILNSVK